MNPRRVAVVILAGGEGSRMGGGKPLQQLGDERLIDRTVGQAHQWSDLVAIAVREAAQVEPMEVPLITDDEVPGPLGGLISGLQFARDAGRTFLLSVPSDMPFLPRDLLERLAGSIGAHACALASSGGQVHPVCGLWPTTALDEVETYVGAGRRSLIGFAEQLGFASVEWPAGVTDPFFNVNTNEDLAEAARIRP